MIAVFNKGSKLWLKLSVLELLRSMRNDIQNKSVFFVFIGLVILPIDVLPTFYSNLVAYVSGHSQSIGMAGFGFVLLILEFALSFWQRKMIGDFSAVRQLESTLPLGPFDRRAIRLAVGLICHSPVLILLIVGAGSAIAARKLPLMHVGHPTVLFMLIIGSFLITELYYQYSRISLPRASKDQADLGPSISKSNKWLRVLISRVKVEYGKRVLTTLLISMLFLIAFFSKEESEVYKQGVSIAVVFCGLISMLLTWLFKPLIEEDKRHRVFLSTIPSRWIQPGVVEYFVTFVIQMICLIIVNYKLLHCGVQNYLAIICALSILILHSLVFWTSFYFERAALFLSVFAISLMAFLFNFIFGVTQ